MHYSDDLKRQLRVLWPDFAEMHKAADTGNYFLGRYICDNSPAEVPLKELESLGSVEELKQLISVYKARRACYNQWCGECHGYLK